MGYRTNPDNAKSEQSLPESGRWNSIFQFKKLIWPAVAFVTVLLIFLIITNVILLFRVGGLKNELADMRERQIVSNWTPGLPAQSAQEGIGEKSIEPVKPTVDQNQQQLQPVKTEEEHSAETVEPVNTAKDDRTVETYPDEPAIDTEAAIEKLPQLKTKMQVTESYNQALAACMSGQYNQAVRAFQQVLQYPQSHQLKDNAQYWLAECYYAQKKYVQALAEFQKVSELFPKADKVFDAELKIAYTYHKLNRKEAAKHRLALLSREWPQPQYQTRIATLSEQIESGQQ